MSDYLDNLVNRTISPDNIVSPRPASLFETAPVGVSPFANHPHDLNPEGDEVENESLAASVTPAPPMRVGPLPPPLTNAEPTSHTTRPPGLHPAPTFPPTPPTLLPTPVVQTAPHVEKHQPDNDPMPIPTPIIQQTIIEKTVDSRTNTVLATEEKPALAPKTQKVFETIVQPVLIPPVADTSPLPTKPQPLQKTAESQKLTPEPHFKQVEVQRIVEPFLPADPQQNRESQRSPVPLADTAPNSEPMAGQPRLVPRIEPAITVPKQVIPAPPAPTIEVTIGRIEVRATPPASNPKKQPAQPLVMSLDEYLRQRVNGGSL